MATPAGGAGGGAGAGAGGWSRSSSRSTGAASTTSVVVDDADTMLARWWRCHKRAGTDEGVLPLHVQTKLKLHGGGPHALICQLASTPRGTAELQKCELQLTTCINCSGKGAAAAAELAQLWSLVASYRFRLRDMAGTAAALQQALQLDPAGSSLRLRLQVAKRQLQVVSCAAWRARAASLLPSSRLWSLASTAP